MCAVCQSEATTLTRGLCPSCAGSTTMLPAGEKPVHSTLFRGSPRGNTKKNTAVYKVARELRDRADELLDDSTSTAATVWKHAQACEGYVESVPHDTNKGIELRKALRARAESLRERARYLRRRR